MVIERRLTWQLMLTEFTVIHHISVTESHIIVTIQKKLKCGFFLSVGHLGISRYCYLITKKKIRNGNKTGIIEYI